MYTTDVATARTVCGLTEEAIDDDDLQSLIEETEEKVEEWTGQWFEPRDKTITITANTDRTILPLPACPISITSMTTDEVSDTLTNYRVPTSTIGPDDRRNPRIEAKDGYGWIVDSVVVIVGSFGFVDADGGVPSQITRLVHELIKLQRSYDTASSSNNRHVDQFVTQLGVGGHSKAITRTGPTGNPVIDEIIARHRFQKCPVIC